MYRGVGVKSVMKTPKLNGSFSTLILRVTEVTVGMSSLMRTMEIKLHETGPMYEG